MNDFTTKPPRLHTLALAYAAANGDVTAESKALVDAAIEDIPKLGWDAPADLLRLVQRVIAARAVEGRDRLSFDSSGGGPLCVHGGIPIFCRVCDYDATDLLIRALVKLAQQAVEAA